MKKLAIALLGSFVFLCFPGFVSAQAVCSQFSFNPNPVNTDGTFSLRKTGGLVGSEGVILRFSPDGPNYQLDCNENPESCDGNPTLFTINADLFPEGTTLAEITYIDATGNATNCTSSITVTSVPVGDYCSPVSLESALPDQISTNENITFSGCMGAGNPDAGSGGFCNGGVSVLMTSPTNPTRELSIQSPWGTCDENGNFTATAGSFLPGLWTAQLRIGMSAVGETLTFNVESGSDSNPEEGMACTVINGGRVCNGTFQYIPPGSNSLRCTYGPETCILCEECVLPNCSPQQRAQCESSINNSAEYVSGACLEGPGWVDTAIGCVPFDLVTQTAKFFLQWGLSIGGGIALALIAISGFMFATSSGDPKKLENSKSMLFSAMGGLLMIVLSVFLLRFIGVNILGLFS